ncbi:MAG: hypothetical protein C4527_04455 [Candidatus Omnitrophota bacterium]|jgi:hypothetical protein|nr:MAG: hypothetical protein C4527_04455 [Candidatus Omnitrophota bacterium]
MIDSPKADSGQKNPCILHFQLKFLQNLPIMEREENECRTKDLFAPFIRKTNGVALAVFLSAECCGGRLSHNSLLLAGMQVVA